MVDLFEAWELQPQALQKIVNKWEKKYALGLVDYLGTEKFLAQVEAIGYTFSYYLDNEPYNLRKK